MNKQEDSKQANSSNELYTVLATVSDLKKPTSVIEPKEKAKQLLWKYLPLIEGWTAPEKTTLAKKLALVCVNEVIEAFNFPKYSGHPDEEINGDEIYWLDVKTELSLL